MSPIDADLETRLRRDLRARQDDAPPAPADLADRVRRRHHDQRRTQALTVVAAAAVVAVFTGVTSLVSGVLDGTPETAEQGPGSTARTILDWPTRGTLADDADWLAGVRRLDWQIPTELAGEIPTPPLADRYVAYAGEVADGAPDGRVALVVGEADGRVVAAWFTGGPGAMPEEMQLAATPRVVSPTGPQAYLGPAGPTSDATALVVVARPDAALDITAGAEVDAGGSESRTRIPLESTGGIYADVVDPGTSRYAEIRSTEPGGRPYLVPRTLAGVAPVPGPAAGTDTDATVVDDALDRLRTEYGRGTGASRPQVLAAGEAGDGGRDVLIGMTFPSGATGVWLLSYELRPGGSETLLRRLPHAPAGTALADRLVGVPVDGYRIAVHAPTGAVRTEVLTRDGRVLGSLPLTRGGVVAEVPGGAFAPSTDGAASLRAVDASGATVAEAPIGRLVTG